MITVNRLDKLIHNKTRSVTAVHAQRKPPNKPSKSKSKDRERKQSQNSRTQTDNKLLEILHKTLHLLHRQSPASNQQDPLKLAEAIYGQVKQLVQQKTHVTQRSLLENSSSAVLPFKSRENQNNENINRSNILHYFKEKFGSPIKDEKSVERKLRALQILKKSQDISSRYQSRSIQSPELDESVRIKKNNIFLQKLQQKMRS